MDRTRIPHTTDKALRPQWDVITEVVSRLIQEPGVRTIHLEGSMAQGSADVHSDVDLLVRVSAHLVHDLWRHRHRIVDIAQNIILDLDHQWGNPSALSYAVLYETGVYLDLTMMESRQGEAPNAVELWSATDSEGDRDRMQGAPMNIYPDPMDDALRMFWMGSTLCAKYLVRGQLWNALWFIESRRALFVKAWRLAYSPLHAEWGWYKVEEDLPKPIVDRLAKSVTALEYPALAQSLVMLMTMMERYGPELAQTYGVAYPQDAATNITRLVASMLRMA